MTLPGEHCGRVAARDAFEHMPSTARLRPAATRSQAERRQRGSRGQFCLRRREQARTSVVAGVRFRSMDADPICPICGEPLLASGARIIVHYRTEDTWQGIHEDCGEPSEG